MDLLVKVKEIKGSCPVYKVGDRFRLKEGYKLTTEIPLCMHSLAALMPFYNALRISRPEEWGLAGKEERGKAYVQCLDPYEITGGGTAIFEVIAEEPIDELEC
jgi:uncharacterized repeat protein (TIGR04076 family)